MIRRSVLSRLAVLAAVIAAAAPAAGQTAAAAGTGYPDRPVRLVIGQAAGGAVDTIARLVAERLGAVFGQPVVVDNRPGAGGMIAAESVARSAPDGYTLGLLDVGALAVNPVLQKRVAYDVSKDFTYVGTAARIPLVLVAHPSVKPSTVDELTRYSKAHPSQLSYASAGVGSPPHMAFEAYKQRSGAPVAHVAYRGGAPALADVVAGHVQLTFIDTNLGSQYAKNGRVKAIAVATSERAPVMPDVPTFEESGLKGFEFAPWVGVVGPAGMPAQAVARLAAALAGVLAEPETTSRITGIGMVPFHGTGSDFAALVQRELAGYRTLVREQNIKLED